MAKWMEVEVLLGYAQQAPLRPILGPPRGQAHGEVAHRVTAHPAFPVKAVLPRKLMNQSSNL